MTGLTFILIFVPFIGGIGMLVLMMLKGTAGPNRFGADPLGRDAPKREVAKVFN